MHRAPFSSVFALGVSFLAPLSAGAASILLDFGPTTATVPSISAAHGAGAIPASESTFNKIDSARPNATTGQITGFLYGDNTAATGVSAYLGVEDLTISNQVNYGAVSLSYNALGGGFVVGNNIYTGSNVSRDGIFSTRSSGSTQAAIGLRIDGLAVGTYMVYFVGRNTNTTNATPSSFYVSTGATSNSFTFDGAPSASLLNNTNNSTNVFGGGAGTEGDGTDNDSFVLGTHYNVLSFTINNAGDSFFLATEGTGGEKRGFINSVEIVSVPEPATAGLTLLGGLALLGTRRRLSGVSPGV